MFLSALMLAMAPAPVFTGPASTSSITELAAKARSYVPKDQFDTAPRLPTVDGQRFDVLVKPAATVGSNGCFGSSIWSYEADQGRLWIGAAGQKMSTNTLTPTTAAILKPIGDDLIEYFTLDCQREELGSYTGTNAYGAEVKVAKGHQRITAIADSVVRNPAWEPSKYFQISGEEARQLVEHLRVRFMGSLQDWKAGVPIACGTRRQNPTYTVRVDRRLDICLVSARIDRVQFVDVRTGRVLYESLRRP